MRKGLLRGGLVTAALVGAAFAARGPLLHAVVGTALRSQGYQLSGGNLDIGLGRTRGHDLVVETSHGEPFLRVRNLDAHYDLGSLIRGAPHAFGLVDLRLDEPVFTLTRRPDGSWDLPASSGGAANAGVPTLPPHLLANVAIRDGRVIIVQPRALDRGARLLAAEALDVDAHLDSGGNSTYHASVRYAGGTLSGDGTIDATRGIAEHDWRATSIPLAHLVNAALNSDAFVVQGGQLSSLDLEAYGFAAPGTPVIVTGAGGRAHLRDLGARIAGLAVPAQGFSGDLAVSDQGATTNGLSGSLAGVPLSLHGGIFKPADPQLRFDADVRGDVHQLRRLFGFSHALPLAGPLHAAVTLSGPAASPIVTARLAPASLIYDGFPIALGQTDVTYDAGRVTLGSAQAGYGPITFTAGGYLAVGDHVEPKIVAIASAPSDALPYFQALVPSGTTVATVLLGGRDAALDGRFYVEERDGSPNLEALGHLDGRGEGIVGPVIVFDPSRTRLLGGAALVRPSETLLGSLALNGLALDPRAVPLPGVSLPALPAMRATTDGVIAFGGDYHQSLLAGDLTASGVSVNGVRVVDTARVNFDGDSRLLSIRDVAATGPLGTVDAVGRAGTGGAALAGRLHADLGLVGRLASAPLRGRVDLPFALQADAHRATLRIASGRGEGVTIAGTAVKGLDGIATVDHGGNAAVVASADLGSGRLLAAGDISKVLGVSASGVQALGQVIDAGALVHRTAGSPSASGTLLLRPSEIKGLPVAAAGNFAVDARRLGISDGLFDTTGMVAQVSGTLDGLSANGRLAMRGRVADAELTPVVARLDHAALALAPAAELDAELALAGSPATPKVSGRIEAPEGSIHGLHFADATAMLEASSAAVRVRHGRVTVGSTTLRLGGTFAGDTLRSYVAAPHVDLADFNDAFNQPNMLAGTGSVRVTAASSSKAFRSKADVDLDGVRFGVFAIGRADAHWRSSGGTIAGNLGVTGPTGDLAVAGSVGLAPGRTPVQRLAKSRLSVRGTASNLELERLLPLAGISAPVRGRLNIAASAAGVYPRIAVDAKARVDGAVADGVPIEQADLEIAALRGLATIRRGELRIPGAQATLAGSFGFAPHDPIALALHAQTADIGGLAGSVTKEMVTAKTLPSAVSVQSALAALAPLDGSFGATLQATGHVEAPQVSGAVDLEGAKVRGLPISRGVASFSLAGKRLVLSDAEVQLPAGDVTLAGTLPIELSPPSIGPAKAPLSLDLDANAVDLAKLTPLFPPKTRLTGVIDGSIDLAGTPANPQLFGGLQLTGGSFVSSAETIPISGVNAALKLAGTSAALTSRAQIQGGSVDFDGNASVASLTNLGSRTAYTLTAKADHAKLDLPGIGFGTLDAGVTLAHAGDAPPAVTGNLSLSDAQIPLSVLANAPSGATPSGNALLNATTLDLHLSAPRNVRVRSGAIDLGATGAVTLGGTIGSPTMDGRFVSDGGTLTYFNRSFHVESGRVAFDPAEGIDPQIHAVATTTVVDPDPNAVRNGTGRATIKLAVSGDPNALKIDLSSDPSYSRDQILGLLLNVPALGAVNFGSSGSGSSPTGVGTPGVTNPFAPPTVAQTSSAGFSVSQTAYSLVNAQFTQSLLAPLSSALGGAVGLSDLAVNLDPSGSLGFSARRQVFGNLYAVFSDSLGVPTRQSLGLDLQPNDATDVGFSIFQESGASLLGREPTSALFSPQSTKPVAASNGSGAVTSGVSFSLNRRFP